MIRHAWSLIAVATVSQVVLSCGVNTRDCREAMPPTGNVLLEIVRPAVEATAPTGRKYSMESIFSNRRIKYYDCGAEWRMVLFPDADPSDNLVGMGVAEIYRVNINTRKASGPFPYIP